MKAHVKIAVSPLLALWLVVPIAFAESPIQEEPVSQQGATAPDALAQAQPKAPSDAAFTQAELDQMLAPIALYPDALLSQVMMAATYPLEVVEAARWSRQNVGLSGEPAVRAVDDRNWDPSVKSLVAFPQILTMMDEKLDWTERLGDAFLGQQPQVMDTVQNLRQRAYAAGNLQSNDQYRVQQQGTTIIVESPDPQVVYVPYYDPFVVYGGWWWPAYRPMYWGPWPGYYARPGYGGGFRWSVGITIGTGFFFGDFDWHHHAIRVIDAHPFYYHRFDRRPIVHVDVWRHESEHRRGVPYRHASVAQQFHRGVAPPIVRHESRGQPMPESRAGGDHRAPSHNGRSEEGRPIERRPDERRMAPPHFRPDAQANVPPTRTTSRRANGTEPDARRDEHPRVNHTGGERRAEPAVARPVAVQPNVPAVNRPRAEPRQHAVEGTAPDAQTRNTGSGRTGFHGRAPERSEAAQLQPLGQGLPPQGHGGGHNGGEMSRR